jgi:putative RNA 2'-phosphotransferase
MRLTHLNIITMRKELESKSKYLSMLLRHKPEQANLTMDADGWVAISQLITNTDITLLELKEIVDTNEKKRFVVNTDYTKIRAAQGHSIEVDLKLSKKYPPHVLYHGTKTQFLDSIRKKGITKQNRNHVHLSKDIETAKDVASRRKGQSVLLIIDAYKMSHDSFRFYKSENGVWLTDEVPPKYFTYKYL